MLRSTFGILVSFAVCQAASANLIYNFDTPGTEASNSGHGDGANPQGWTDLYGASKASTTVLGGRTAVVPSNEDSTNAPLVFSSPAFFLTGSGVVTMDLSGGQGYGSSGPANFGSDPMPANPAAVNSAGTGSGSTNFLILGLRNVATDSYVAYFQKTNNNNQWDPYTWNLSALAGNGVGYSLDLIDNRNGGWGHLEIDNVNIPGNLVPEPASLVLLGMGSLGLFMAARRRRKV